jgi:hypothetical protein
MAYRITNEWIIDIPEDLEHRVEDGKLVFWKTGITVITVAFRLPENTGKLELLNQIQRKMPDDVLETFVSTKGEIVGLGYTKIQKREGEKNRLSLYTFTASDTTCLQVAYYLDDPKALEWAKTVWQSTIYHPAGEGTAGDRTMQT